MHHGAVRGNFNSGLKHLFLGKLMRQAEANTALSEEQRGLQKDKTTTDATLKKMLAFECRHLKGSTIVEVSYNCKAYFDWVERQQSNIFAMKQNMDEDMARE